jgi:hypothetical protein
MISLSENHHMTPVAWCKMTFGFQAFDAIPLWEVIKDGLIVKVIREKYERYLNDLLLTELDSNNYLLEDRGEAPRKFPFCPMCGCENKEKALNCITCGFNLEN